MNDYNTRLTLIKKIQDRHDDKSWEEFIHFYEAFIYSIILRLGVSPTDKDDLAQKVLLKIWESLPAFEYRPGKSKFRNWIYTITSNQVFMFFRSSRRYNKKLQVAAELELDQASDSPLVYQIADEEWRLHISKLAWDRIKDELPESYRQCFLLLGRGYRIAQVCTELKIKENSAHVYRQRVLKRLQREIRFLESELS